MASVKTAFDQGIIEVPPELRGPSNEEILQKEGREDTPMRRRAACRPSKRERMQRKLGQSSAEMKAIASKYAEDAPRRAVYGDPQTHSMRPAASASFASGAPFAHEPARTESRFSVARKKLESLFSRDRVQERAPLPQAEPEVKREKEPAKPVVRPEPPSGRVLRGSFGAKPSEASKAQVYSAAELSRIRMEERAKKIRAELARKSGPGPLVDAEGNPVKRPRGRPRKNPLP